MGPAPKAPTGPSRAPVAMPRFSCETTCFSLGLLFVELCVTATFFSLYGVAQVHQGLYMTSGIISLISISSGFFGLCRSTPAAVTSLIVSVAVTLAFVLLGGLCIVFTFDVPTAVASHLNKSLTPISQAANKKLIRNTKIYLSLAASALLTSAAFHAWLVRCMSKLLGGRRGAIAFLQTFSLIVLPFSLFLVLGGQYIVDTGTLTSAPYTGVIIFGCGTLLLAIAMLSFIGGTFEYRRLLSICVLLSYVMATLLIGLSIAYFALKSQIQVYIMEHWQLLRVVLPPTFQARYDHDQFVNLVQTNLMAVAYVAIICGLFTFQNAGHCVTLMHLATTLKRQMAHDRQSVRKIESLGSEDSEASGASTKPSAAEQQVLQRHAWAQYFESSKRRQRIAMRIFAFLFVLAVGMIFAVMCTSVVFTTKCNSIAKLVQDTNFTLFASTPDPSTVRVVNITNKFARGTVAVVAGSTGDVRLEQFGNAEREKKDEDAYTQQVNGSTLSVSVRPIDVTQFLWLDGSCQRSVLSVELPTDTVRQINIDANTSVDVRGGEFGPSLPVRGLTITTDQGNVNTSQLMVLENGLRLTSESGLIGVSDTTVNGQGHIGVDTRAKVYSGLGGVAVSNMTFLDCDAEFKSGAGTLEITDVAGSVTTGRSRILVESSSGTVFANSVRANWLELKSTDGDIFATDLRTQGNNAFMGRLGVTSISGEVTLQQIDPRGSVHVETSSGSIKLQLKTMAFSGLYYLRSDFGNVSIRTGLYGTDVLKQLPNKSGGLEKQGGINCDPSSTSCLSYGDLHLHSRMGDIEVILGCDSFQCV